MCIGEVIRKYRKEKGLTQNEMAKRLGVTAPAVNKWEKGNSLPDTALLSPIARLLDISIDILLSHEKELTAEESDRLVQKEIEKLKTESVHDVFSWVKEQINQYPSSYYFMLLAAQVLDSHLQMEDIKDNEEYGKYIIECYKQALEHGEAKYKTTAAEALFHYYFGTGKYEEAEKYLEYFSTENPERKRKLGRIYSYTNRKEEAYKIYEELLYTGYQNLNGTLHDLYMLAMEERDFEKAHTMIKKESELAKLFEFGTYHEAAPGLELAVMEKDKTKTMRIASLMLQDPKSIFAFANSSLYSHMSFSAPGEDYFSKLNKDLLDYFRDKEAFAYMKGIDEWESLIKDTIEG